MKVNCRVSEWLRRFTGGLSGFEVELETGSTLKELMLRTGIPPEEVGFATVNNVMADEKQVLMEGDEVRIYPPIIGG